MKTEEQSFIDKPVTFDRFIRLVAGAALVYGLIQLLDYLSDVLLPFAVAVLIAYLINPLVLLVQKKIPNRVAAVFLSLSLVLGGIGATLAVLVPMVSSEIAHMGRILADLARNSEFAQKAAEQLPADISQWLKDFVAQERVHELLHSSDALSLGKTMLSKAVPGLYGIMSGATNLAVGALGSFIVLLYVVFLLFDYQLVRSDWKRLLPLSYREPITEFVESFNAGMSRYFRAQAAVAAIVGVLFSIGFAIIGLPLGILLGLFIGLLNMVPYLQIIGLAPALGFAAIHAIETDSGIWLNLALVGLVFVVVQTIQDAFLVPRIMGKATGLRPAMILLSLSIWGKLLGILGMLIALPMTCLLVVYYQRFLKSQHES